MLSRSRTLVLVAGGGFAGANARWGVAVVLARLLGTGPAAALVPTLAANVTGAFALGAVLSLAAAGRVGPTTEVAIATGFLSSYTTYSTFAVESVLAGSPALVAGNVFANYALGFAGALVGRRLGRALAGGGER